jgi:hypothetical protein
MLDWLADQRAWLHVERLPGYAPDLNPIEQVWGNVKSQELANLCADTLARCRRPPKTDWTASAATPHSASPSSVTPVCTYDPPQPAIARASLSCPPRGAAFLFGAVAIAGGTRVDGGLRFVDLVS